MIRKWAVVDRFTRSFCKDWILGVLIFVCTLIVFGISYVLSIIYIKICEKLIIRKINLTPAAKTVELIYVMFV